MDFLNSYTFMNRVFPLLDRVSLWKSFYSALLRFMSVGTGIFGFFLAGYNLHKITGLDFWPGVGFLIFKAGLLVTTYMLVHLFWHRSYSIRQLEEESYPILRIFAHLARMTGEVVAILATGMGFSAGVAIWFSGSRALWFSFGIGVTDVAANPFIDGSLTMILGLGYAVLGLLAGRMCFELMALMIDIAQNVRRMRLAVTHNLEKQAEREDRKIA